MLVFQVIVEETEKRWLDVLFNACEQYFSGFNLPSHDHNHHLRVWQNAKRLMCALCAVGKEFSPSFIEQLIIAIFFHDTGLTLTYSEKHGKAGSDNCQRFFDKNHLKPKNFTKILTLIENHENKTYSDSSVLPDSCEAILSAADDIDAFGVIGVFRYFEIYNLRDITIEKLPEKVIQNLDNRFNNLQKLYGNLDEYFNEIRLKYWITREFYLNLEENFRKSEDDIKASKVIRILASDFLSQQKELKELAIETAFNNSDVYVSEFFTLFASELDRFEDFKCR
jgi:hypothetical protein